MKDEAALRKISVELLHRGRYQARCEFAPEDLAELADSIKSSGIIQPIVVRLSNTDNQYEIVAGERRWRAAQLAGLSEVSCLVKDYSDEQAAAVSAIENINRVDLNPIEEAHAYQHLIDEFDYIHEEIAAVVGKSRAKISNALRLLKLSDYIQGLLITKEISEGHGKILAGLTVEQQHYFAEQAVKQGWAVRQLQQAIKQAGAPARSIQSGTDIHLTQLEREVSDQIGTKVKVEPDGNQRSGWLKIRYYDHETLAGVLDKMGVEYE